MGRKIVRKKRQKHANQNSLINNIQIMIQIFVPLFFVTF